MALDRQHICSGHQQRRTDVIIRNGLWAAVAAEASWSAVATVL